MNHIDNIHIPTPNDFQSVLGGDSFIDKDLNQICTLTDSKNRQLKLVFSSLSRAFSLTLVDDKTTLLDIYNEYLDSVYLSEDGIKILIELKQCKTKQEIQIIHWPEFTINYSSFDNET